MNAFTIKDLENLSGIKAHTIRIWEQRYNFLKPGRTQTNIRSYTSDELKVILNVALLNKYGFKISHIDKMNAAEMQERILSLMQSQAQQERIINELIQQMIDLDLDGFENTIDDFIRARGVEKSITQIIFPYLERIGILWVTSHINPAQEHLTSNIIRQKLISGIENVGRPNNSQNRSVLLFLPEGEHHELGLLFICYLLKSRGVHVFYLGANVPLKDLEYVIKLKKPDIVYSHLTSIPGNFNMERFLNMLHQRVNGSQVVFSGPAVHQYKKRVPENITLKRSLSEVNEYLASI